MSGWNREEIEMASLEASLAEYLQLKMPDAAEVRVDQLEQIFGGTLRQTYRFRLTYVAAGESVERRLILRRDPSASLIDTDRRIEFAAYRAFSNTPVPVPDVLWLEDEARHLGSPFLSVSR